MKAAKVLRKLLEEEKALIVPEIYDCFSAKAAELNGFKVIMVSSGDLACGFTGIPDLQLLSVDEFVMVTERITNMSSLPLILDIDEGFGRPLNTYYACKRLMKAGAAGVLVTDAAELGKKGVLPDNKALLRIKAARDGLGPDGYLIARCDVNPETNFEEAMERCEKYREAGADMICMLGIHHIEGSKAEMCEKIAEVDTGPKWYPDLASKNGVPEVEFEDIANLNYKLSGVHFSAHAAMIAMLDAGRHVFEEKNNTYIEEHYDYTGYKFFSPMTLFGLADDHWPSIERKYVEDPQDAISVRNQKFFCRPEDEHPAK